MADLRMVVTGAAGRMGRMLVQGDPRGAGLTLAGALEREGSPALGQDPGRSPAPGYRIAISRRPAAAVLARRRDHRLLLPRRDRRTRGARRAGAHRPRHRHDRSQRGGPRRIDAAARHAPIVRSGNMSLGVNLLAALTRRAAAALGDEFDIEIVEMHHRIRSTPPRARR